MGTSKASRDGVSLQPVGIIGFVMLFLALAFFILWFSREIFRERSNQTTAQQGGFITLTTTIPVPGRDDHYMGSRDALVVLIVYSDFRCPHCIAYYGKVRSIVESSEGTVAAVYRHFPVLGLDSLYLAQASECVFAQAGEEGFWRFTTSVYEAHVLPSGVESLVQGFGLDVGAFKQCVRELLPPRIEKDLTAAQSLVRGTPATFVYGTGSGVTLLLRGNESFEVMRAQIMAVAKP